MTLAPVLLSARQSSVRTDPVGTWANERFESKLTQDLPRTDPWTQCLIRVKEQHDAQQFASLFQHFAPRIKSFLMKSGASDTLAEETAQEAMVQVWRKAHLFDPAVASASTWIYAIVRNKRIDALRKDRRPEPEDLPWGNQPGVDAIDVIETSQESIRLREAIGKLPDDQRAMITKAYFGELSHSEVAAVTGLPLGTIKSRTRLGLDRLRRELGTTS